jgi:peroxiredoxin
VSRRSRHPGPGEIFAWHAYARWYSWFDRTPSSTLSVGLTLPDDLPSVEHGRGPIAASELRGRPTVLLFYRGNWCPLCMAQIAEIAERWREIEALGGQVALVSPQDEDHTRKLAARHGVAFRYLRDEKLEAAHRLGIVNADGTPAGLIGYDGDTVLPALVVTDAEGRIVYADQTDDTASDPRPTRCSKRCTRPASCRQRPRRASHPEGSQTSSGVGSPALSHTTCPSKLSLRACSAERRGSVKWVQPS